MYSAASATTMPVIAATVPQMLRPTSVAESRLLMDVLLMVSPA